MGVVVADGGEAAGLIVADLDPDRLRRVQEKNPALTHRRPDLYGPLAEAPARLIRTVG
jgi:predicted amidohydrolase